MSSFTARGQSYTGRVFPHCEQDKRCQHRLWHCGCGSCPLPSSQSTQPVALGQAAGTSRSREGRPLLSAAQQQPKASAAACLVTAGRNFAEFDELRVSHGQPFASSPRRRTHTAAIGRSRAGGSVGGTFDFGFRLEVVPTFGPL